jgi:urease gamma subunit
MRGLGLQQSCYILLALLLRVDDAACLTLRVVANDSRTTTKAPPLPVPHKRARDRHNRHKLLRQAWVTASVAATLLGTAVNAHTAPAVAAETLTWNLMNGSVQLPDTLRLDSASASMTSMTTSRSSSTPFIGVLRDPTLIGVGAGGAVFTFSDDSPTLLKVSWAGSAKSVARECLTLQRLQDAHIQGAERCLGQFPYGSDDDERIMIVVEPYVKDAVASISDLHNTAQQGHAVAQVARTLVQMLAANVVTIDVQPLISQATGDVIFIDMTEAQTLHPPFTFLDTTLMASFTTEMLTLIPEAFQSLATQAVWQEIQRLETDEATTLSTEAMDILSSQLDFSSTG